MWNEIRAAMFEKSLTAMVKGIRAHRGKESDYIHQCVQEIQKEVTSKNLNTKSMAILKLAYLAMLGYDMSWSRFAVVEVMSHARFAIKRPGYLASSISFTDSTDVGLLTINLFKKDFGSKSQYESGMAISCLSSICTPEISRDILTDLMAMLSSSRAYLRKKTVLCLFRVFLKDPPALRTCFPKLKDRLADEDQGVLTATVNTFLELARKNARNYLSLVPQLYHILVNTTNNWLSIKLLKVFQLLCPLEPRLPGKMVEPLTNILNTTKAASVEFEAIRCAVRSLPEGSTVIGLSIEKLQAFLNSSDRNLRYLALELFKEILERSSNKEKMVSPELHEKVLTSIEEADLTARRIALQLLDLIASPGNFGDAVKKLLEFSRNKTPNDEFINTILRMGARDRYALVEDFAWYLFVLADLSRNLNSVHAGHVAEQFVDVALRVPQVRPAAVMIALGLLDRSSPSGFSSSDLGSTTAASIKDGLLDVSTAMIGACAWIVGEYHGAFEEPRDAQLLKAAKALLTTKQALEPSIQAQCVWAATKLYLGSAQHAPGAVQPLHELLNTSLPSFVRSTHVDVSERAALALHVSTYCKAEAALGQAASAMLEEQLLPVHPDAQGAWQASPDLLLDEPFFHEEVQQETFKPVRSDPADPYALASTYKDDLGFLAAKEAPRAAATAVPSSEHQSMYYLQSKDAGDPGKAAQAEGGASQPAAPADPLEQLRERLGRAGGSAGATKYEVIREEIQVAPPVNQRPLTLHTPSEKELTDLQGRLWSVCFRDDSVAVYSCIRANNTRKQQLRIDLRCERIAPAATSLKDLALSLPAPVTALEADASGFVPLAPGELQERSPKVKMTLGTSPFVTPTVCTLACELHYTVGSSQGSTADPTRKSSRLELVLPSTTFLVPVPTTEETVASFISQRASELLQHQAVQAVSLQVPDPGAGVELQALVARCAALCHFHVIPQQGTSPQGKGMKFLLVAEPPALAPGPLLEGQAPLLAGARLVCLCAGLVRDDGVDLRITVKSCQKDVSEDVCAQLAATFRELVEGRLRS